MGNNQIGLNWSCNSFLQLFFRVRIRGVERVETVLCFFGSRCSFFWKCLTYWLLVLLFKAFLVYMNTVQTWNSTRWQASVTLSGQLHWKLILSQKRNRGRRKAISNQFISVLGSGKKWRTGLSVNQLNWFRIVMSVYTELTARKRTRATRFGVYIATKS